MIDIRVTPFPVERNNGVRGMFKDQFRIQHALIHLYLVRMAAVRLIFPANIKLPAFFFAVDRLFVLYIIQSSSELEFLKLTKGCFSSVRCSL
jgi:hypothetical protein